MRNRFGEELKKLRNKFGYTQRELSNILGIKQTTISNYEKGLRFPDADKLKQISDLFNVSIDYLLNGEDKKIINKNNYSINKEEYKEFLQYLLNGYKNKARDLILNMYNNGIDIEWIYFNILEVALKEVGVLWEVGEIDVWNEHYISESILDIMREVKSYEKINDNKESSVICLTAGSEQHNIGIKMIADLLEVSGIKVIYLGSNLPTLSIINAIKSENPKYIAISVTISSNIESAKNVIKAIRTSFKNKAPLIIVGGMAFTNINDVCKETDADFYCKDLDEIKMLFNK
ncbi:cobalamin-dependent protein [Clostridium sp.]|uniref:cobalamin-dependent protein n=1 Tax=Clostridium sp. TaxID=1506 RepID=UPI0029093D95|nr:cobalamin-dependent protein [Clostridium sp.]MDU5108131.1 cobalamin-dependent protein [Clostridium sp.]